MEAKRLVLLVVLVVTMGVSSALVMSDTGVSLTGDNIPHNETTISQAEAGNSLASAGITMYAVDG